MYAVYVFERPAVGKPRKLKKELLLRNKDLGDGTFLVRPSETFVGAYSLSFLRKGEVYHVPIKDRQQENGRSTANYVITGLKLDLKSLNFVVKEVDKIIQ